MSDKKEPDTEQKILQSAKNVFYRRGFYGARMQEIADEAGINKAMLHYYFRSKDKLFYRIFSESLTELFSSVSMKLDSDMPFREKIEDFVDSYISFIEKNPFVPGFILHEMNHNPERLEDIVSHLFENLPRMKLLNEIQKEIDAGRIIKINPKQFVINMLALCVFPFIAKPLISHILDFDDTEFKQLIEERKKILPQIIFHGVQKTDDGDKNDS